MRGDADSLYCWWPNPDPCYDSRSISSWQTLCCVCPDWQTLRRILGIRGNPPPFHETPCKRLSLFHLRRPVWAWYPQSPAPNFLSQLSIFARRDRNATVYSRVWQVHLSRLDYRSPDTSLRQLLNRNLNKTTLMRMWRSDECLFSQAGQVSITGVPERTFADACKDGNSGRGSSDIRPDFIVRVLQISLQSNNSRAAVRFAADLIRYCPDCLMWPITQTLYKGQLLLQKISYGTLQRLQKSSR